MQTLGIILARAGSVGQSGRRKWVAAALLLPVLALVVAETAGVTHLLPKRQPAAAVLVADYC